MKSRVILALFAVLFFSGCVKNQSIRTEKSIDYPDSLELKVITLELGYMIEDVKISELMMEYNLHLFNDEFHPEDVEKEFFEVFCIEDEHEIEISADAPFPERLEVVGWWCYGLDECCQEFGTKFLNHLDFFHPDSPLGTDRYELVPVPDTLRWLEKLPLIIENMKHLSFNVESLNEAYKLHIEEEH